MGLKLFKKKIFALKDLGAISLADIGGKVITSIFWLYLVTLLETKDYGIISFYVGIASLAQLISLLGTTNALTVYVSKDVKIQSTFYMISLIAGSISSVIIFIIFQRLDIVLLLLMLIICDSVVSVMIGKKQYAKYASYNLVQKILLVVFGIGFFYTFGVNGIIYGMIVSYGLFIPVFCKHLKETPVNFSLLKDNKKFIVNNYIVMLASGFRRDVDKLIIPPLLGFAALGNYALAIQVYTLLMTFSSTFFKYILPHDATGNQNKRLKKWFILFTILIAFCGVILMPIIVSSIFPKFTETVEIIQIMSLSVIPSTINMIYLSQFLGLEKGKFVLIMTAVQLVTIIIGFVVLGSKFGMIGFAISFVLSATASTACAVYLNHLINKSKL